uniref:hypothetical protein n=1 Tax=Fodinicola feengrottensis TaxID=435914 RepID=UPI0036F363F0
MPGSPPAPGKPRTGCAFATRCGQVFDRCRTEVPALVPEPGAGHRSACLLPGAEGS